MLKTISLMYQSTGIKTTEARINPHAVAYFEQAQANEVGETIITMLNADKEHGGAICIAETVAQLPVLLGVKTRALTRFDTMGRTLWSDRPVWVVEESIRFVRDYATHTKIVFLDGQALTVCEKAATFLVSCSAVFSLAVSLTLPPKKASPYRLRATSSRCSSR